MKFSVIMPVYGVEKYLHQAIDSVLTQTFSDFELILVDDCSPDACPQICDDYAAKDCRVKIIHKQKNEGLGMARNTGFLVAQGEYIWFMDSDDYVAVDSLEKISATLEANTQILVFGITRVHQDAADKTIREEAMSCPALYTQTQREVGESFAVLSNSRIFPFVCNKVYEREFLVKCDTLFESTKLIEDFLFNIAVFGKAHYVKALEESLYFYRKPAHQTLASAYSPEFFALTKRKYQLEGAFLCLTGNDTPAARAIIDYAYIKHVVSAMLRNRSAEAGFSPVEQRDKIREMLSDAVTERMLSRFVPCGTMQKVLYYLMKKKRIWLCYYAAVLATLGRR